MNSHQDPPSAPDSPDSNSSSTPGPSDSASSSSSSSSSGLPHAGAPRTSPGGGFFGWLRSLNTVRGQDRWIGGVATGIAARTGLDPILVRGLFVVLAVFGGIGLLAYGLAWALLPEPDGRIHAESAARGSWTSGMTGALIVSLLGLWRPNAPIFGNTGGFGGFLWSLFWIGVAVFVVYWISSSSSRKKNDAGTAPGAMPPSAPVMGDTAYSSSSYAPTEPLRNTASPTTPLSYGPPPPPAAAPAPPKPAAPRPSGADVAVFLGGALLLAALVLFLDYTGVLAIGSSAVAVALATGVVVLGLGVVLLGLRGRTSGALGFLAAVGTVATLIASASPATGNWVLADQGRWSSTAAEPAEDGYTVVAGQGRIDLTELAGITDDVVVPIATAAGNVQVLVPDDVPVDVRSRMALSSTELITPAETTDIGGIWQPGTLELNEDAAGPRIILDLRGVVSHVTIATTEDALNDSEGRQEP